MINKQPSRKSIRLKHYDYGQNGYYFVTICTHNRALLFGNIATIGRTQPAMRLNTWGQAVQQVWQSLPDHHPVALDAFQIMPNHVHCILIMDTGRLRAVGAGRDPPVIGSRPAPTVTLGNVVGLFKSECTKRIRRLADNPTMFVWQRNYYEHVIRAENDLNKIREYIETNPLMWDRDRNNPAYRAGSE